MAQERTFWQRFLLMAGSIGPLGHLPASGTVAVALVGLPLFWLMSRLSATPYLILTVIFAGVSVWVHQVGDGLLGEKDSRLLVWDELAGFFVAVALVPFTWQLALASLVIERILDISKFPPAGWIEKRWPGGWGVVGDDLVAGLYTCAVLHAAIRWVPDVMGVRPG